MHLSKNLVSILITDLHYLLIVYLCFDGARFSDVSVTVGDEEDEKTQARNIIQTTPLIFLVVVGSY